LSHFERRGSENLLIESYRQNVIIGIFYPSSVVSVRSAPHVKCSSSRMPWPDITNIRPRQSACIHTGGWDWIKTEIKAKSVVNMVEDVQVEGRKKERTDERP
jgi:hypothetical protein